MPANIQVFHGRTRRRCRQARERGIQNGDIIRVYNEFGEFLRPASVTRTVMPGVVVVLERAACAFGEALSEMDSELAGEVPCTWRIHEYVVRHPLAKFGRIEYAQTVYIDETGEHRRFLDEVLGMPARVRITSNAADALAACACSASYANACDLVARHCRVRISEATVAAIIADVGAMLKGESAKAADELFELGIDPGGSVKSDTLI